MSGELNKELFCNGCGWSAISLAAFVERLQAAGMLKRNTNPRPAEVLELSLSAADRLSCPDCGGRLTVDGVEDWPTARNCEQCGKPVPLERLEVFPSATVCVTCQHAEETGQRLPDGLEFCNRCGSPMTMRSTRSGVTRYEMRCTSPGCRGRS